MPMHAGCVGCKEGAALCMHAAGPGHTHAGASMFCGELCCAKEWCACSVCTLRGLAEPMPGHAVMRCVQML